MGLDAVELILAVEDTFQIFISDEEASNAGRVGDLLNLILRKLREDSTENDSKRCLTSVAFYRTRRGIVDALGVERRQIRPSTPLAAILPRNGRREKWRRLQAAMSLSLPGLEHGAWAQAGLLALGVALAVTPGIYRSVGYGWLALLVLMGFIFGALLMKVSHSLALAFPNREATVGDLARDVAVANQARLISDGRWTENDAWEALCRVIVGQLGVAREKITPEARFAGDLGID